MPPTENNRITEPELVDQLFCAIADGDEDAAMRLLDEGVSPLALDKPRLGIKKRCTAFDYAVSHALYRPPPEAPQPFLRLIPAMLARLTQEEKDEFLTATVQREGHALTARILLVGGANPRQKIKGRSLLQLTRDDDEEMKRMLRAAESRSIAEAATVGDSRSAPWVQIVMRQIRAREIAENLNSAMGADADPPPPSRKTSFTL